MSENERTEEQKIKKIKEIKDLNLVRIQGTVDFVLNRYNTYILSVMTSGSQENAFPEVSFYMPSTKDAISNMRKDEYMNTKHVRNVKSRDHVYIEAQFRTRSVVDEITGERVWQRYLRGTKVQPVVSTLEENGLTLLEGIPTAADVNQAIFIGTVTRIDRHPTRSNMLYVHMVCVVDGYTQHVSFICPDRIARAIQNKKKTEIKIAKGDRIAAECVLSSRMDKETRRHVVNFICRSMALVPKTDQSKEASEDE